MGFFFTLIGSLIKGGYDLLTGFGIIEYSKILEIILTVIGYLLFAFGILRALKNGNDGREKLFGVLINIAIWLLFTIGIKIIIPVFIVLVVIFIIDRFALGGAIGVFLLERFSSSNSGGRTVSWPSMIFDTASSDSYRINYSATGNDYAVYNRTSDDKEVVIYYSDVKRDNTASNHYGSFRW